jgi:RimJ/RimL family protein N-acetyltransferase
VAAGLFLQRLQAGLDPRPFGAFLVVLESPPPGQAPLVVGGVGFHGGPDEQGRVEIGYAIVPSHQRRGYATQALGQLVELARELGAQALIAEVDEDNAASRAVLARCGFVSCYASSLRYERTLDH